MDPTDPSTTELVKKGVEDAKELVKSEVALAKDELLSELTRLQSGAIRLLFALVAITLAVAMTLSAIGFATGSFVPFTAGSAIVLGGVGGVSGLLGYRKIVGPFLRRTRGRLGEDMHEVKREAHGT